MKYSLRSLTPKRRFQFSLKSLFVALTITALSVGLLSWLRSQMNGKLDIDVRSGPMKMLFFHCANAQNANDLADHFDERAFLASVRESLRAEVKDTSFAFYLVRADKGFAIQYEFSAEGEYGDNRNAAINQAIDQAGRSYAASHATITRFEHSP